MKIIIINGPNLNLIGSRETEIYGDKSFDSFYLDLKKEYKDIELDCFQSNVEGEIINKIQESAISYDGIILNAAAYSHTSIAILDTLKVVKCPVVEVHISNIWKRESYRHISLISEACVGVIVGFGLNSYKLALESLLLI